MVALRQVAVRWEPVEDRWVGRAEVATAAGQRYGVQLVVPAGRGEYVRRGEVERKLRAHLAAALRRAPAGWCGRGKEGPPTPGSRYVHGEPGAHAPGGLYALDTAQRAVLGSDDARGPERLWVALPWVAVPKDVQREVWRQHDAILAEYA